MGMLGELQNKISFFINFCKANAKWVNSGGVRYIIKYYFKIRDNIHFYSEETIN